jgi:hypothetical protein
MAVYGISDLHLSFMAEPDLGIWQNVHEYKPMSIFGEHWREHYKYIYENWQEAVQAEDTVLLPGDLSWGLKLEDCIYDFAFLGALNGNLLISKGNHDYWWQSLKKVKAVLPANTKALQHSAVLVEGKAVCATRGWLCPGAKDYNHTGEDEKIYLRELIRLEMALKEAKALSDDIMVMLHYRPVNDKLECSGFIDLMSDYGVKTCIYGHIHTEDIANNFTGEHWGMDFKLVACDYLGFNPLKLWEGK